ncbi:Golgi to ER traffic protein 4-like protein [Gossypium australe]|uniref:Golgi to ER traffic protein 4-like protein n=1 Tax=Gossypium australe TaxID=47621 RepID=A0A5B6UB36_9ROSI|nr:Golgi to ER traffic protein 4-like protein [Gossypium australe]
MSREKLRRAALPPVQENIDKLEKAINEGNFYGAQQMYKSISARYVSAERYSEALDLLESGACLQLKHGQFTSVISNLASECSEDDWYQSIFVYLLRTLQVTCGAELAVLFVDTLVKGKIPYNEDILDRVRKIYEVFPKVPLPSNMSDDEDVRVFTEALGAAKTRLEGCSSFLRAAIKWSAEFGASRNGDPQLHAMLAEYIYSESTELNMAKVSYHFVRGNNPKKFASTLVNFMSKCYPDEDDIAIARAVLIIRTYLLQLDCRIRTYLLLDLSAYIDSFEYLSMGNLRDANCLMDELKRQVESQELDFPESDLIQFITFLLLTLERDALPLFNMLRVNYKSSMDREPAFNEVGNRFCRSEMLLLFQLLFPLL